jgi:hypothetical protein
VHGLQKAPQHNGKSGSVQSYDPGSGRYTLELSDGDSVSLKSTNICCQVSGVRITGIASKPEINDKTGKIIGFDGTKNRYTVQLSTGAAMGIAPGNVVLPTGTRALVVGLESAAAQQYNDKRGLIESFDTAAERYLVKVSEDKQLKIKLDNLRV